ncbi:hypothetical protein GYMLUDRAFT_251669 [Collybiopsis luxurians FD-317 M1]|uniref:Uncharacterized protein n=1 Tax=Collybiopsis luxurians FD-317 M1 TaxID=944289 RepID=A0A0D0BC00_9AGAR|nr:hypothetical protein GYMLUDRAFT_251669 [Collybiopsis luxurians FD-317 M1]
MSALQLSPNQPAASSSNPGGSRPQIIFKFPPAVQPMLAIPLSNALPSVPSVAKKMQRMVFKHSLLLAYPSIPVSASTPSSLPSNVQSIYDNAYLANSSPEVLEQVPDNKWRKIFALYPSCKYCALHNLQSSCSLRSNSLSCATCEMNYPTSKKFCLFKSIFRLLQFHILAKLPLVIAYRFVSSRGNFIIWDEEWAALTTGLHDYPYYCEHPEELGLASEKLRAQEGKRKAGKSGESSQLLQQERVHIGEPSRKPVVPAPSHKGKEVVCDTVDINVEMEVPDAMDSMDLDYLEDVSLAPVPIPAAPAPVPTKSAVIWQVNNRQSYMIRTVIECVVTQIAELLSGPGKKMLEQDLWALVDGMIQGVFNELKEQLFIESLSMINLSSANIMDAQQDELLRVYWEYQALSQKSDHLETENLHLQEQVVSCDIQSTEVQQLRGAVEVRDGEIEELRKKLAASEEACRIAVEESKLRDEELAQLWQLFELV